MTRPNLLALLLAVAPSASFAGDPVEFNRDIRPILSENCYLCHGPDKNHRKVGLRLDVREAALTKEAFVPGQADESELVTRIFSNDPEEVMPPPESTKILTPTQKDLLKRWIAEGAKYQAHWAYEPIRRPALPILKDPSRIKNPIDAFILSPLEARGIKSSPEADRRTLIRRLSLDLIGLPPTVEEVRDYESDPSPDAYEKLVDRLLASPHYGERMAVPWLDLARFADTVGYHGDQNQHIFPYRDYVIDSFNRNLPFDRFTTEQLAGDLLPNPTPEQLVATGFNRLNMMTREGGAQPKEYLAKYAADRVRTVAITWLGSTMGCAECHDHKFDPFTARDFYRMEAFFADVKQWGVYMDYNYTPNPELRGFSNDHPFPPEIEVESPYLKRRIAKLDGQIRNLLASNPAGRKDWVDGTRAFLDHERTGWETPEAIVEEESDFEEIVKRQADGAFLFAGKVKAKESATIRLKPRAGWVSSIRLQLLPRDEHSGKITREGAQAPTVQVLARHLLPSMSFARTTKLAFSHAEADHLVPRYSNGYASLDVKDGWRVDGKMLKSPQSVVYHLETPIRIEEKERLILTLKGDGLGCVRFQVSPIASVGPSDSGVGSAMVEALKADPESRTPEQSALVDAAHGIGPGARPAVLAEYLRLTRERRECHGGKALSMITRATEPLPTRVLPRGNWQDESGELLSPGVPKFLPQPAEAESKRLTRLDLARWLTSPENPLTARVFANRIWKQFFGTGLSAVMEDVGAQGEWPSHPELLDWLAVEFRDGGWNVKDLVKRIVMSSTYRQDARLRPELRESDPANRLLASQSPRRLEAEFVRDNALVIAGLLNPDIGGPSVKPYQPAGYYAILQFPDRVYSADHDDRQYRRGLYTHWQRTFLQPMMANFDAPGREECTAARVVANTPQQALTLLNDPTFVEAARVLAGLILEKPAQSDEARLDGLFEKALARPARTKERDSLLAFLANQRREARDHPEEAAKLLAVGIAPPSPIADKAELAAWTEVCRVVLNLHESITRY
jgi:Protein of unknown function (DUF1553)/Protein of unknown function (DUF1549)/Planctomycete cytochrome C